MCNEIVGRYASVVLDQLILYMQTWDVPYEKLVESVRTFGEQVIPNY